MRGRSLGVGAIGSPRLLGDGAIGLARLLRGVPVWRPRVVRILQRDGLTLAALVAIAAARRPDEVALLDDDGPLTYAELEQLVASHAGELPPDLGRVEIREPNHRSFVIAVAAALRRNADVVLLDPRSPPVDVSGGRRGRRGQIVLMTSGSTGSAKGVERGGVRSAQGIPITTMVRLLPISAGVPLVVTPPLFHGFGLGFLALGLAFGMPVVLRRRLDPAEIADFVRAHPGCLLVGVPPVLARIERAGAPAEPGAVVSGAGSLHPAVAARLSSSYGPVVFNLYGSSEDGWSTIATPADLAEAPGTIGRPAAGVRVAVLDESGKPLRAGEIGHLCVASRLEFAQYAGGGGRARLGGMADSGDLGHYDTAGRFFVDGRADDMVVTGGENVFPTEVEDVLLGHPAVAEVMVDGVPDEEYGARLEAFVVRRPSGEAALRAEDVPPLRAEELIAYARTRLVPAKVPRIVHFVAALPMTPTGKPRRRVT
ncbi:acyl-CoA synthetase (AMP-forming)/AMP-acid ligase II [Kribbella sp. VKM Ac-2527]|uniref:Acyl-CoA synthetase (AMP-forming)/AMP-acid ligase II n=1 Tax=Kribbella caucasensis TaxID=2512215 RepID=A0A4R6KPD3_9ACTN|nr:AMP-binding protein [Kribbella sp. VKM Ac-2527]TDO52545.1 acyl-CoA synthetase (AMP-forming)/AMP-acid ligase II [Kribbella sp. VKM Ac-2527]